MAIQMMKGYGMPSAGTVDFSGYGSFDDYAANMFVGRQASGYDLNNRPEQFQTIPPLDGYNGWGADPTPDAPMTLGKVLGWGAAIYFAAKWLK